MQQKKNIQIIDFFTQYIIIMQHFHKKMYIQNELI